MRSVFFSSIAKLFKSNRYGRVLLAEGGLVNLQRTPHQRLGFNRCGQCPLAESPELFKSNRHGRVLLAEGGLVDLQRTPHQRFGFLDAVGVL